MFLNLLSYAARRTSLSRDITISRRYGITFYTGKPRSCIIYNNNNDRLLFEWENRKRLNYS